MDKSGAVIIPSIMGVAILFIISLAECLSIAFTMLVHEVGELQAVANGLQVARRNAIRDHGRSVFFR